MTSCRCDRRTAQRFAASVPALRRALSDAVGAPTDSSSGSQGWIFRDAFDALLEAEVPEPEDPELESAGACTVSLEADYGPAKYKVTGAAVPTINGVYGQTSLAGYSGVQTYAHLERSVQMRLGLCIESASFRS